MEGRWVPGRELPVQQEHTVWTYMAKNQMSIVLSHYFIGTCLLQE